MTGEHQDRALFALLDSSALHSAHPEEFVSADLKRLVQALPRRIDVTLFVPHVVRHERRHRMLGELEQLASALRPLGRLLERDLNIVSGELERAVDAAIERAFQELHLTAFTPDLSRVPWTEIVEDAVYRRAPFEAKGAKGFRDRVVIESARQATDRRPSVEVPFVLVTRDKGLAEAARKQLGSLPNVYVFEDLENLADLISATAAGIPYDDHERERLAALITFYGRDTSQFRGPEDLIDLLRQHQPQLFEPLQSFGEMSIVGVDVDAPVFLDAFTGTRLWRSKIALVREVPVPETLARSMDVPGELAAPGGVATEFEGEPLSMFVTTIVEPSAGQPGFERMVIRDVLEVMWVSSAYGAISPGKVTWRNIEKVVHVKRVIIRGKVSLRSRTEQHG